jgi:hypothetical protein
VWWGQGDPTARQGLGVSFDCPLCVREGRLSMHGEGPFPPISQRTDRTFAPFFPCAFANPLDGGAPLLDPGRTGWTRTGDTFETLTLSPSIDASAQDHGTHKGWHGHVQNGEIVGGGL